MDYTVMDFMLCQSVAITILREHVGLEVGDEGRQASSWSLSFHILSTCKQNCLRAISKRAMFKYAMPKTQTLNCKRFNALELPDKADQSNKLQVIL
jgi:hypothetical protein